MNLKRKIFKKGLKGKYFPPVEYSGVSSDSFVAPHIN